MTRFKRGGTGRSLSGATHRPSASKLTLGSFHVVRQHVIETAFGVTNTMWRTGLILIVVVDYAIALVRGMAHRLEHGGGGTDDVDMTTARRSSTYLTFARHLLVPRDCQLAVYHPTNTIADDAPNDEPPDDDDDGGADHNNNMTGNGYARYLDRCEASIWQLGLVEYWRLSDYPARVLTIILYLNDPDRSHSDGGALRYWRPVVRRQSNTAMTHNNNGSSNSSTTTTTTESPSADDDDDQPGIDDNSTLIEIIPVGGTLVIFDASRIHHQVLPSFGTEPRTALTCWVMGEMVPTGVAVRDLLQEEGYTSRGAEKLLTTSEVRPR
jgi:hypothetical protein